MKLGTTFSELYLRQQSISVSNALDSLLDFSFDTVRLCSYWNLFEPLQNEYDFSSLNTMLEACEKRHQKVLMTIGMKSPRWPEFHLPDWAIQKMKSRQSWHGLFSSSLPYIWDDCMKATEKLVRHLRRYDCIQSWQVENEPLDPSGPYGWQIPYKLLKQEVELVRSLDKRPIMLTVWGNALLSRNVASSLINLSDSIGIDLYYAVPESNKNSYSAPEDSDATISHYLAEFHLPVIISELQAEPWEHRHVIGNTPSMNAAILENNIRRTQVAIRAEYTLLWGFEYWYQRMLLGDDSLWNTVKRIL